MDFSQRLKNFRLERGLTQQELAAAVNASVVGVRNWERGARRPTMDMLLALGRALNVSIDTLTGFSVDYWEEPMVLSKEERNLLGNYQALDQYGKRTVETVCLLEKERVDALKQAENPSNVIGFPKAKAPRERFIPRYTTPSAAGINAPLDGADFEMILVDGSVPEEADFAVDIQGNSMYPYIHDGEMVYVKKDSNLTVGDVGIFCVDGAMYCKQYYRDGKGNLILASANPELKHTNIFVSADSGSSVKCCGKVLLGKRIELPEYLDK